MMILGGKMQGDAKTTISYRREGFSALADYRPLLEVEMSIDSTDETVYNMLDFYRTYLLATGYAEENFYEACYQLTEEYELKNLEKQKTKRRNRYRMGETGIDSENFTLSVGEDA